MPSSEPNPDAAAVAGFGDQLAQINRGAVADQAALQLAELVAAVRKTGRQGSIILKLTVTPYKGDTATVEVAASTTLKLPAGDPHAGVFYTDDAGQLHRHDPSLQTLDFSVVETPRPGAGRPIK